MTRGPREQQHLAGPTCRCGFSTPPFRFCRCSVALARGEKATRIGGRAGEATDGWAPCRWDPHVGVERAGLERLGSGSNVHRGRRALRRSRDRSLARSPPDESAARRCGLLLLATAWPPAAAAMWGPTVSLHATQTQAAGGAFAMRPTVDSSLACL